MLTLEKMQKLIFIVVDEIEDERCAVLEFNKKALFESEISPLKDIDNFD